MPTYWFQIFKDRSISVAVLVYNNQFKPVKQSRQQVLRVYCPNVYTVPVLDESRFCKLCKKICVLFSSVIFDILSCNRKCHHNLHKPELRELHRLHILQHLSFSRIFLFSNIRNFLLLRFFEVKLMRTACLLSF